MVLFGTVSDTVWYSSVLPEKALRSFQVDRITVHLHFRFRFQSSDFSRFFFPHFCIKVMDSVSLLLNIFTPKCEHAAELRTFRILNCSQLESRFIVIQHVSHRKKKKGKKNTYLPYLMFFSRYPNHTINFFLPNESTYNNLTHHLLKDSLSLHHIELLY